MHLPRWLILHILELTDHLPVQYHPVVWEGTHCLEPQERQVHCLLDFLIKTTDAKILNQQTIWTKDNEEASFFKGSNVPFLGATTLIGAQGGSQQAFNYELVGMELKARPGITPDQARYYSRR